jgi:hypothetical protein
MKSSAVRNLLIWTASLLCWTMVSLTCFFTMSHSMLEAVRNTQTAHARAFVPAKREATAFEREILNARIFFIYYVTIQKPGALENGWQHYHRAEATLQQLTQQAAQHPEVAVLQPSIARLQSDLDAYAVVLTETLNTVQQGHRAGSPVYDEHVKNWAEKGGIMVADAGKVQTLAASASEASTDAIVKSLNDTSAREVRYLLGSLLLAVAIAWILTIRIRVASVGETHQPLLQTTEAS